MFASFRAVIVPAVCASDARAARTAGGTTLVESLVALVLVSAFIGGMYLLIVTAQQASDRARDRYTAVNIAKNRLERARTFDYDDLDAFRESNTVVDEAGFASTAGRYRRTTAVSLVATNLKEMVISVAIRSRITLQFGGQPEVLRSYFAHFIPVPEQ